MTTEQRHELLTTSIRQLSESMEVERERCRAANDRRDHRAADRAVAAYQRMLERREYLQDQLERLALVLSN